MWNKNENYDLDTSVSYKKDSPLLKLTLRKRTFQISFVLHLDEAVHILYKPLPLPI